MKIVSKGFVDGFYFKPRVDLDVLRQYSGNIIALSACCGYIPVCFLKEGMPKQNLGFRIQEHFYGWVLHRNTTARHSREKEVTHLLALAKELVYRWWLPMIPLC